ncbi:toprim domain-containing protein [Chitinophaga sp. GbtcB8]|uniref:toprim domain-containing protein n=1 Tax=Chitinophaga sp. GbtcB8 TaxID=2824753 RepID=UPI001C2F8EA6|nr:toprim domain-containing protein [Chitinophaga sp. GbtcB8]
MNSQKLSIAQAKQIDLVDYLFSLGYKPEKIRGSDHWYHSPLRIEKTPSFKVNRKMNVWFDHGIGEGGNIIDFGILYHNCSVSELLEKLQSSFSFHPPLDAAPVLATHIGGPELAAEKKIKILSYSPITSPALCYYLRQRCISISIAQESCYEVRYELAGNQFYAIGFKNNSGGFELRNANFKGSSSPKDVTLIDNLKKEVAVFEGFFSYLAYLTKYQNEPALTNFLVLNSLAFFNKSRHVMEAHQQIHLFLDRDTAGMKYTEQALKWSNRYIDRSEFYQHHKDLNSWLIRYEHSKKQNQAKGRHL